MSTTELGLAGLFPWNELDGEELKRIRRDIERDDCDRVAAGMEEGRRQNLPTDDLYELECWTMDVTEKDLNLRGPAPRLHHESGACL